MPSAASAAKILPRADSCRGLRQARRCGRRAYLRGDVLRFTPDEIAERDKIGTGNDKRGNLIERGGITDARDLEHFRPPGDAFFYRPRTPGARRLRPARRT